MKSTRIESKQAVRLTWPDGSRAFIHDDGEWDLTLPNGKHRRGTESNSALGQAAVDAVRNNWILEQWDKGQPARQQKFLVPLT